MKDLNDMLKQMTVFEYRMDQWKKPSLLEKMSKWDQTERICLEAVRENSHALKYVSKRIVNYEICKEAVMNNGLALMYVPQEFRTIELCEMAVMRNGEAVLFVPEELLSNEICERAVRRNPRAIAHIPNKYKSSALCFDTVKRVPELIRTVPNQKKSTALCHAAVEQDGLLLEHVPEKKKTKELCKLAVEQNPNALEYVPQELKDRELCEHAMQANIEAIRYVPFEFVNEEWADTAIQNSWELALYIPDELYTIDRCSIILDKMLDDIKPSEIEDWYDYNDQLSADDEISQLVNRWKLEIQNDSRIVAALRELRYRRIEKKYYDAASNRFIVEEHFVYRNEVVREEFFDFEEFYRYLMGDLENADLFDYDFSGVDISNLDIKKANISSEALISQNRYNDAYFREHIYNKEGILELKLSEENEIVPAEIVLHDSDFGQSLGGNDYRMYYISDIHLNHRLQNKFPEHATKQEVVWYVKSIAEKMIMSAPSRNEEDYLLIAGDVSYDFEIAKIFYSRLIELWNPKKIVVVLGNHELWDWNAPQEQKTESKLAKVISKYRRLSSQLGIRFLHNELLLISEGKERTLSEKRIHDLSVEKIRDICLTCPVVIYGGLGFSGLAPVYNATSGLYRDAIKTLEEDIEQTSLFEATYKKVEEALKKRKVIVLTHMPKENWAAEEYNPQWIYVNGHTHRNEYYCDKERVVYSDNQIGYSSSHRVGLKHFYLSSTYDYFLYYEDGIHKITKEKYLDFSRGMKIDTTFNRTNGSIYMLKNQGVYLFIFKMKDKLYLLNGGKLHKLEKDCLEYYFDRMVFYSLAIKNMLSKYHDALKKVSNYVRKIGGSGTVHGSIVDIDFWNHIYLNPLDGTITPYYAESMTEKHVYKSFENLLSEKCPRLYENYERLRLEEKHSIGVLKRKIDVGADEIIEFVSDTYMYKPSRVLRSLQYIVDASVIRVWNDELIDSMVEKYGLSAPQILG